MSFMGFSRVVVSNGFPFLIFRPAAARSRTIATTAFAPDSCLETPVIPAGSAPPPSPSPFFHPPPPSVSHPGLPSSVPHPRSPPLFSTRRRLPFLPLGSFAHQRHKRTSQPRKAESATRRSPLALPTEAPPRYAFRPSTKEPSRLLRSFRVP